MTVVALLRDIVSRINIFQKEHAQTLQRISDLERRVSVLEGGSLEETEVPEKSPAAPQQEGPVSTPETTVDRENTAPEA